VSQAGVGIPRRAFLAGLGLSTVGLALGFFGEALAADAGKGDAGASRDLRDVPDPDDVLPRDGLRPSALIHLAVDGTVSIVCARSEMGQGVRTSLPALIADELGADMARVKVLQATGDKAFGDQNTDGSSSVRGHYEMLRRVGATARLMLATVAAKRWAVPLTSLTARDHRIVHEASKRAFPFGELVAEASTLPIPLEADVKLRPKTELLHSQKPMKLLDGKDIVTGKAVYGADVKLPGMLTAVMLHPPVVGGKVVRFDATRALAVPGVRRVVELPPPTLPYIFQSLGGLAVVADHTWAALRGRAALDVTWDGGENAGYDSDEYREELLRAVRAPGKVVRKTGDVTAALASAARQVEAEYHVPHLAHATMEPPCAVARILGEGASAKCEIWATTQNPQASRTWVAKVLGLDESQVTVHVTLLGGGFGRKSKPDYVVEAALVARQMNAPVRLQWTREDEVQHDYFHTTSAQRLVAGLDGAGKVTAWLHRTAFPPIASTFKAGETHGGDGELGQGVLDIPLAIPNVQAENGEARAHVRIGWMRSVNNIHHAFAMSSFIDELAHARGADPKAMVLEIMGPPRNVTEKELGVAKLPNYGASLEDHPVDVRRMRHVVERVTEMAGWARRGADASRGYGLAVHRSFLSCIGAVVAVTKNERGKICVDEAWVCADAGTIVNPERVQSQLEGAVLFAMSFTLYSRITAKRGAIEQSNFHDYRLARIHDAPRAIHVEVVANDEKACGVGEPGVPPIAPAIANAVFALTGTRVRELPLSRSGLVS
jgi:isoquinoline 1-oxidoreductase beta subunit